MYPTCVSPHGLQSLAKGLQSLAIVTMNTKPSYKDVILCTYKECAAPRCWSKYVTIATVGGALKNEIFHQFIVVLCFFTIWGSKFGTMT